MNAKSNEEANREAFRRMDDADPVLEDIRPAIEALPGMTENTVLASGPKMDWADYFDNQREGILGGALYEGLATDRDDAIAKIESGAIRVAGAHEMGAVGSLAGIYTASMPVFVVRNKAFGNAAHCNFYEGTNPRRLNYGIYDEGVKERLTFVDRVVAPVVGEAVRRAGGIPLKPIMTNALNMGDELHSRNTASSLLFLRELMPQFLGIAKEKPEAVEATVTTMTADHYFFLRLSLATAKATADGAHGVEGSSVVTGMGLNCKEFAIRVSGLGDLDHWIRGDQASVEIDNFDGHSMDEIIWMGGDSAIAETVGLGGFAQAAAFFLQRNQGKPDAMVARNLSMYEITVGENSHYKIPYLEFRGTPSGIDLCKVVATGILPVIDMGVGGKSGYLGAGVVKPPMNCFTRAAEEFRAAYGE